MEQERVVAQVGRSFMVTGEFILKTLYLASTKASDVYHHYHGQTNYTGHTSWQKFMSTNHTKEVKDFLANKVNLDALKQELSRYGIGFAFHHHSDGSVSMAYDFKNKAVVEAAFERVIEKIIDNPEAIKTSLTRDEKQVPLGEKIKAKEATMMDLLHQTKMDRQAKQEAQVVNTTKVSTMTSVLDQTNQAPQLSLTKEKGL